MGLKWCKSAARLRYFGSFSAVKLEGYGQTQEGEGGFSCSTVGYDSLFHIKEFM